MSVFSFLFCGLKNSVVLAFICSKYGLLQSNKRVLFVDILTGCMGRLRLRNARSGLLCGHVFPRFWLFRRVFMCCLTLLNPTFQISNNPEIAMPEYQTISIIKQSQVSDNPEYRITLNVRTIENNW